ncbi:hypothetical protein AVEN_88946-1 [Araneus ventricosus]|uniref:Uncharacterized protein n=1 Tax=Araneus ventricosus TaxID=182803 RepID=A0A4Y2DII7_ARAVE|nr:hypothetical protein AVEN_88946-1 [Araneus ventricosus]
MSIAPLAGYPEALRFIQVFAGKHQTRRAKSKLQSDGRGAEGETAESRGEAADHSGGEVSHRPPGPEDVQQGRGERRGEREPRRGLKLDGHLHSVRNECLCDKRDINIFMCLQAM